MSICTCLFLLDGLLPKWSTRPIHCFEHVHQFQYIFAYLKLFFKGCLLIVERLGCLLELSLEAVHFQAWEEHQLLQLLLLQLLLQW